MTHLTKRIKKIVHELSYSQRRLFEIRTGVEL
jgi:hypothetical protein